MLISSESGAGQIVSPRDETRFYDDVGCLAADWAAHGDDATAFVRTGSAWRDATAASFARPDGSRTAMDSGFVAFATEAEAKAADSAGRALSWNDVVRIVESRQ
jgi:hypothetical protein